MLKVVSTIDAGRLSHRAVGIYSFNVRTLAQCSPKPLLCSTHAHVGGFLSFSEPPFHNRETGAVTLTCRVWEVKGGDMRRCLAQVWEDQS